MKKLARVYMALVLSFGILTGCGGDDHTSIPLDLENGTSDAQSSGKDYSEVFVVDPHDWEAYDSLITEIRTTADLVQREALMHQAEDMLMNTGAILPVCYDNDVYLQKDYVSNIYSNLFGCKFFLFAKTNGDTLRLNIGSEPETLDPALNATVEGRCLAVNSFAGLYTYDGDHSVVPDLAADEQVSEDGLVYTITLLPELKWSDGSELNAGDFVYAWNRAIAPETASDAVYLFDMVARYEDGSLKVEAGEDGQTLVIELSAPCAYFNTMLASPAYFPVKQSEAEGHPDWETSPGAWTQEPGFITNGAYTLAAWSHGESMTYVKNPNYHRADEVEIETLQFMLTDDEAVAYAAYNAGSLDFIDTVPADEIPALLGDPELRITDRLGTCYTCFNVNSPLFDGKTAAQASAVRRAFALLVDRGYICRYIGKTGQKPANTLIPIGMADGHGGVFRENDDDYTFQEAADVGYFDPLWSQASVEEAIALLTFAGYEFENGMLSADTPISLEYLTDNASGRLAVAEALQQDFGEIGVELIINSVDQAAFQSERRKGDYDMVYGFWLAEVNDPVSMLELWTTGSGNNDCWFGRHSGAGALVVAMRALSG